MSLPEAIPYCVIGGGVHGLSTAYHLARELEARGQGSGRDIIVLEKNDVGAGASGIACGVVRNFYFSPAMAEIIQISVEIFESDAKGFGYQGVGYIAAVPQPQVQDCVTIQKRQAEIGYRSELILGEQACRRHMETVFPDFCCEGIEAVLHEYPGGFADPRKTVRNLARWAESKGVAICRGVEVSGFDIPNGAVRAVRTNHGEIATDLLIIGAGPWSGHFWKLLDLPWEVEITVPGGRALRKPICELWKLQEGQMYLREPYLARDGNIPPVLHLDQICPLVSDQTGRLITEQPWGIYWKKDTHGIQGGALPLPVPAELSLEPYGHANPAHVTGPEFTDYFTAGLAWAHRHFRGRTKEYGHQARGGIGAFTPDRYPIIDFVRPNALVIMDSNHGFKMLGVGKEVAKLVLDGHSRVLHPFRFSRYRAGDLHPTSHSPYPWN